MISKELDAQIAIILFIIFGIIFGIIIGLGFHIGMWGLAGEDSTLESALGISCGFGGVLVSCMIGIAGFGSLLIEPLRSKQVV